MTDDQAVRDEPEDRRYRLDAGGGEAAYAYYELIGDVIAFTHTETPPDRRGGGVGSRLVAGALADARRRGLEVIPQCPFVAAYMEAHPETQDLLAARQ